MNYYSFTQLPNETISEYYGRIRAIAVFSNKSELTVSHGLVAIDGTLTGETPLSGQAQIDAQNLLSPNTTPAIADLKKERDDALDAMEYTYTDGKVVQVRPGDLSNFNLAISAGVDVDWVLKDDTVRLTTVAELQEALNSGIAQGTAIWKTYTDQLKLL